MRPSSASCTTFSLRYALKMKLTPPTNLVLSLQHSVKDGKMTCRNCGHIYVIKDGIPNMLLSEDEI